MDAITAKYGIWAFLSVYLAKTLYEMLAGQTKNNTAALGELSGEVKKLRKDLRVLFFNMKKVRDKQGLGDVEIPPEFDQ